MSNLVTKFVVKYNVMGRYLTQEEVITRLTNTFGDKLDYSKVTYVTNRVNVCIVCPIHGEFYQTPHSHLSGRGCPKCLYKSQYNLYNRLCNELPNLEILYEYSPDWLGKQRFDIYIPKYNIAIEYNGEQHYKPMAKFGGVIGYNKTVERDSHKLEKCKANNCKLYVLRYNYKNNDLQEIINTIQSLN